MSSAGGVIKADSKSKAKMTELAAIVVNEVGVAVDRTNLCGQVLSAKAGGGGGEPQAESKESGEPSLMAYIQAFLDQYSCFHDPIFPKKIMESPVMIPGDKNSYDKKSLEFWEKECRKNGHVNKDGKIMLPSNFNEFYDPKDVTENANLKQALAESNAIIREHYKRMYPESSSEKSISEIYDSVLQGGLGLNNNFRGISSNIFADLDRISKLDLFSALKLRPPQIIVLGNENNGKSTLLERLIGFSIFPTRENQFKQGACTICPVRVHLRRTDAISMAYVKIRNRKTNTFRNVQAVPIICLSSVLKDVMDKMRNEAPRENPVFENRPSLITEEEIVVEIQTPSCPNLDILDLPGLSDADQGASLRLADDILTEEKGHSLVIMVVKDNTINVSKAPELIIKHKLLEKTTGVYTFIDNFKDNEDDGTKSDELLQDLFSPPVGRQDNFFKKLFWMGCSNLKPKNSELMHDSIRLLRTDEREAVTLKTRFPTFLSARIYPTSEGKELLGVPAIRARVEGDFERYICKNWARDMHSHLIKHFYSLSDRNLRLGRASMIKIKEYSELVDKLAKICKEDQILPDYDVASMLHLNDPNAIKDLVTERSKIVCANGDWLKLYECKDTLYATFDKLAQTPIPQGQLDFDKSFEEIDKAENFVIANLEKIRDDIIALGRTVSARFVEAALKKKKKEDSKASGTSASGGVAPTVWGYGVFTNVKSFVMNMLSSEKQTEVLQIDKLPGLLEDYSKFMDEKLVEINNEFKTKADKIIDGIRGNLIFADHTLTADTPQKSKVTLKFQISQGPRNIGVELLNLWLRQVMSKLPTFTEKWTVPESCFGQFSKQPVYEERKKLLGEMVDVANALKSIKDLQIKYNSSLILYNGIDNFTSAYSASFSEDIVLNRKGKFDIKVDPSPANNNVRGMCLYVDRSGSPQMRTHDPLMFTSDDSNKIHVYNADSGVKLPVVIGATGKGNGQFDKPYNMCVGPSTKKDKSVPLLYVSEVGNHRVQVMFADFLNTGSAGVTHYKNIGTGVAGAANGQLNSPQGICIGPSTDIDCVEPLLYVADSANNRVSVFNAVSGVFVKLIGAGQLNNPTSICVAKKNSVNETFLFISDTNNNRVQVYSCNSGELKGSIATGLKTPASICVGPNTADEKDQDPILYVADQGNNRIQPFKVSNAAVGTALAPIACVTAPKKVISARSNDGAYFAYVACVDTVKIMDR